MASRQPVGASDDGLELREYVAVLRRHSRLIGGATALGLLLGLAFSFLQTPMYTAHAAVVVQPTSVTVSSQPLDKLISVGTEARIVKSEQIASAAADLMGSGVDPEKLLSHVDVQTSTDTFVLDISYSDPDPTVAAAGANAFAQAYLTDRKKNAQQAAVDQQKAIASQMEEVRTQQRTQNAIIASKPANSADAVAARAALDRLDVQLAVLASQLSQIPPVLSGGQIIVPATPPSTPSSPKYVLNALIGLFFGLFVGVVLAFVTDRNDDTIHTRSDLTAYTRVPVIAKVPHFVNRHPHAPVPLPVETDPQSASAEAYSMARTMVMALARRDDIRVVAVTSAMAGEGKSMTSANLVAALGRADVEVLAISADLRKPRLHALFGAPIGEGLTEVLTGRRSMEDVIVRTRIPHVSLLTSGTSAVRPNEILQSTHLAEALEWARQRFDLVLIDCAPSLGLSDTLSIVPLADAVLLVVQADRSKGGAVVDACDVIERAGSRVQGIVLNDVRPTRGDRELAYGYYGWPQEPEEAPAATEPEEKKREHAPRGTSNGRGDAPKTISDLQAAVREADDPAEPGKPRARG